MSMKISVIIKKLSNPRIRRRLKIGLSVYGVVIIIGLLFKVVYDIGYFNAQSLKDDKNAEQLITHQVLTMEAAQRIVSGALKEDPMNPKTIVVQIIDDISETFKHYYRKQSAKKNCLDYRYAFVFYQ